MESSQSIKRGSVEELNLFIRIFYISDECGRTSRCNERGWWRNR